jgi:hypothetical protein
MKGPEAYKRLLHRRQDIELDIEQQVTLSPAFSDPEYRRII